MSSRRVSATPACHFHCAAAWTAPQRADRPPLASSDAKLAPRAHGGMRCLCSDYAKVQSEHRMMHIPWQAVQGRAAACLRSTAREEIQHPVAQYADFSSGIFWIRSKSNGRQIPDPTASFARGAFTKPQRFGGAACESLWGLRCRCAVPSALLGLITHGESPASQTRGAVCPRQAATCARCVQRAPPIFPLCTPGDRYTVPGCRLSICCVLLSSLELSALPPALAW